MRPRLLGLILLAACSGNTQPALVTPAEIASLETERAKFPNDHEVLNRIGIRFYEGQDWSRAQQTLTESFQVKPSFVAAVYLGLTNEATGHFDDAEGYYRAAGSLSRTPTQHRELDRRLTDLGRARLRYEARQAIARESTLTATPPEPGTIAVMPWAYVGSDESLRPLGYGVAQLVVTDLSKISSLKLVERERVQVLLDELELASGGHVDPRTAARAGRLLRAERVVQGLVRQTRDGVRLEATILRTADGTSEATMSAGDKLERLFSVEKTVVLGLLQQFGVGVTPAELRAITERPAQDLQAFLAASRGAEAEARTPLSNPGSLTRVASAVAPTELAARTASLMTAIAVINPSTGGEVDRRTRLPVSNPRLPEALGQDNPSRIAIIGELIIVIPRP
ncbi:MAG TPA: CsgG/HfaB family protein [Gemmatimonadales bacterium]|nr:CsgG/HfaB family protein [Gemmatimonadales bacterium]